MTDTPLTDQELAALRTAGYEPRGGGIEGNRILVYCQKDGALLRRTRAEWRVVIAGLNRSPIEVKQLREAGQNACRLIRRLCHELGYDQMLDPDGVRKLIEQIESVFFTD